MMICIEVFYSLSCLLSSYSYSNVFNARSRKNHSLKSQFIFCYYFIFRTVVVVMAPVLTYLFINVERWWWWWWVGVMSKFESEYGIYEKNYLYLLLLKTLKQKNAKKSELIKTNCIRIIAITIIIIIKRFFLIFWNSRAPKDKYIKRVSIVSNNIIGRLFSCLI